MTDFWVYAAAMAIVALVFLLPPLLRRRTAAFASTADTELAVYRQRYAELQEEHRQGALSAEEFAAAKAELETALVRSGMPAAGTHPERRVHGITATVLAIAIPMTALALYGLLGAQDQLQRAVREAADTAAKTQEMQRMLRRLETHLAANPADGKSWHVLGQGYIAIEAFEQAAQALRRAEGLLRDDPDVLLDLAQAQSALPNSEAHAQLGELVQRALSMRPDHPRALWMAGFMAMQSGQRVQARRYLERLYAQLDPEDPNAATVKKQIETLAATPAATAEDDPTAPGGAAQVAVRVELAPAMQDKTAPDAAVFVFARAKEGPRMPLAVVRLQVKDLPQTVTLDDSTAMNPAFRLSRMPEVVVGARVSRSGNPVAQSGDLEGYADGTVKPGAPQDDKPVAVTIDKTVP